MLTKTDIVRLLECSDTAVARAVVAITERQTFDEKVSSDTKYRNGRGWRPCHARVGTSMADFYLKVGKLTPKQLAYWRKRMACGNMRIGIYAGQLLEVAKEKDAKKQLERSAQAYADVRG